MLGHSRQGARTRNKSSRESFKKLSFATSSEVTFDIMFEKSSDTSCLFANFR